MGSCVDQYSPSSLAQRDYGFDGVVRSIESASEDKPDRIAFAVNEWFKGGSDRAVSRRAYGFTATTSAGGSPHAIGQRLLVAGDDDYVWECGFTQPYDARVAAEWRKAFGG